MVRALLLFVFLFQEAAPPDVAAGMALAREGDFEAAVIALDAAARRLEAEKAPGGVRALAYLHLGIAYLELDQELLARARFADALLADPQLTLDPRAFSAQVIRVFEAVRAERRVTRAAPPPARGKSRKGLLIGGGVAVVGAGVAALAGGGGSSNSPPTTTLAPNGAQTSTLPGVTTTTTSPTTTTPGSTPTSTTLPSTTTTVPGTTPPTSTLPTSTTTTTTTTVPATTTTTVPATTTTTLRRCQYSASPSTANFIAVGGTGTCTINTSDSGCPYTARSTQSFLRIQAGGSGSTPGVVEYAVDANAGAARAAFITIDQDPNARCEVRQAGVLLQLQEMGETALWSTLDLPGGSGQVVVDGRHLSFVEAGPRPLSSGQAPEKVEATVVSARATAGTWLFRLPPGSGPPRVIAGQVLEMSDRHLRFALTGRPGERILFVLAARRD